MENEQEQLLFKARTFNVFLNGLIHQWLKTLMGIGIFLIPLFGVLDYFLMPEGLVKQFWVYRLINTLILLGQFFIIRYTRPDKFSFLHGYFGSAITSITIIQMTVDLGGFNANYFQGLNLVIIAVNLLIPWRSIHSAINGSITVILYIVINAISNQAFDSKILVSNLFFMTSTVIISVSINHVRHNLIKKEFQLRTDLKAARDALWGEMEIAKKIQTSLLPEKIHLSDYEVYATMLTADEVGGDYYDIIENPYGETWMAVGDVSGHGVESGLIMMMTHTCISSLINQRAGQMPSEILDKVNYVIKENIHRLDVSRYVTLTILKIENNHFYHSGKHQDILIYRAKTGKLESIQSVGTWIGITENLRSYLHDEKVGIEKGDVILLYTDGIVEAENSKAEMFGYDRLLEKFLNNAEESTKNIVDSLIKDVNKFQHKQMDDITILACRKL